VRVGGESVQCNGGVGAGVVTGVDSERVRLQLLGPLTIARAGAAIPLPQSRKARALIAYLSLAARPVARSHLCELLWDVPNDPRGELRWCLSKVRGVLDARDRRRVIATGDAIALDLGDCKVDALEVERALQAGVATQPVERLRALARLFAGEFLEGLELASAPFSAWLIAQRRRFRAGHAAILEHLVNVLPRDADELIGRLEQWLQLAPFDRRAHAILLDVLAERGRLREAEEHLAAAARLFEAESLDWAPLGHAWRAAKSRHAGAAAVSTVQEAAGDAAPAAAQRASIAVMPFADHTRGPAARGGIADGLAYDVITRLAKLRSLFVIAQGTVFALDQHSVGAEEAGRTLNVDYVASGSVRCDDGRVRVSVQLAEARTARILWADVFGAARDDALAVLDEIGERIVASIASQIETAERNRAILKPPNSLNAWEAHHRGLWHMYRFNRADNDAARHFFETAVRFDPTFARPYAGLSFTHFQNAFLGWGEREREVELAYRCAAEAMLADDRDPAAHWALGRAQWLRGRLDESLAELDTSVELSPNFALGHYTRAFVHAQSGNAQAAIVAADHSRALSPFDPLLFAMLATRAIALLRLGRLDEAATWAVRAAARPNAHVHIVAIASYCLALAGRVDEAQALSAKVQRLQTGYRVDDLLAAFRLASDAAESFRRGAVRLGG
jgi:DNA-binding SARP family transcriptional activator